MIESVQLRHRGAYDFESHYDNLCAMQDSCPLPAVKSHLGEGVLDINGDRVRVNDWQPILSTLRINKSLEFIAIRSYYQPPSEENEKKAMIEKRKMPSVRSKEITYRLCKALKECLINTPNLSCLELQGLPLRERDLTTLMKGLVKNNTVSHVSLEYCRIGDNGLDIICKGIKNSTTINSINFTGCSLSARGAESLAKVIKHQAMKRHNEAWRDSLRYRRPDLDRMPGIRRITINNNPILGDQGTAFLAEALKDDLWLKALDVQGCGISTTGARALLDVLKYNTTVVVLDVRRNPLIDRDIVHSIMEQLMINCNGQDTEYKWIKADESLEGGKQKSAKKRRTKTLNSSFGRKTTIRISAGAARRRTKSAGAVSVSRKLQPISSEGIKVGPGMPWRTAARANRYRGFPPEHIPGKASLFENSETDPITSPDHTQSLIITKDDEDTLQELEKFHLDESALSTGVNNIKEMRVEVIQMRRQLQQEKLARAQADKRVVELTLDNKKLREEYDRLRRSKAAGGGGILEDDSVLESIEGAFKQFHQFLDLLRDAGLGQLITMAGLDHKDSPFVSASQLPATKSKGYTSSQPKSSTPNNASKMPPRPIKSNAKSNGYLGDISSNNQVSQSTFPAKHQEDIFKKKGVYFGDPESRHITGSSAKDPTMNNDFDSSFDNKLNQAKTDQLYERILQETQSAFPHMQESEIVVKDVGKDMTSTPKSEEVVRETWRQKLAGKNNGDKGFGDESRKNNKEEGNTEANWSTILGEENIQSASDIQVHSPGKVVPQARGDYCDDRRHDNEKAPGREGSRMSDYNYSIDSFDQSYVSERGEKIHFEGDLDTYESSPSPPPQPVDSDDNDF